MPIHFDQFYVNGEWRDAADGATLEVCNPATGDLLARVASATIADGFAAGGRAPWDHGIPGDTVCITRMVSDASRTSRQSLLYDEA
jgi:hypothetical protein